MANVKDFQNVLEVQGHLHSTLKQERDHVLRLNLPQFYSIIQGQQPTKEFKCVIEISGTPGTRGDNTSHPAILEGCYDNNQKNGYQIAYHPQSLNERNSLELKKIKRTF